MVFFRRPLALLLALLLSFPLMAATQTWTLNNRPATDVATQLRQLYPSDQAAITAHNQQLIVRGDDAILAEIDQLIGTMDVAPVQFRITVRSGSQDNGVRQGAGLSITNNTVTVRGEQRVTSTQRVREQSLIILDGQSAHIHSGQVKAIPVAIQGGFNPAALYAQVSIRSGYVVSPRLISPQQVELNVMAFDNVPQDNQPGYETEAIMTTRRVEPGAWVDLGGSTTTQQHEGTGIVFEAGSRRAGNQTFQVQVEIL